MVLIFWYMNYENVKSLGIINIDNMLTVEIEKYDEDAYELTAFPMKAGTKQIYHINSEQYNELLKTLQKAIGE